jgi:hypothetical protein
LKHVSTAKRRDYFKPLLETAAGQAGMMVLKPKQKSSEHVEDEHPKAEQWVLVLSDSGTA